MPNKVIEFKRWEIALAFMALTIAFVVMGIILSHTNSKTNDLSRKTAVLAIRNSRQIAQIQHDKASIDALERTNCKLKTFLITSARFRQRQAGRDTDGAKTKDLTAAKVSLDLANSFSNEKCPKGG